MPPSYRRSLISVVAVLAFGVPVVVAPNALASRTAKAAHLGDRPLRPGASGPDVRELQQALGKAGFKVKVDGNFGTGTLRAVKRFQRASRLRSQRHGRHAHRQGPQARAARVERQRQRRLLRRPQRRRRAPQPRRPHPGQARDERPRHPRPSGLPHPRRLQGQRRRRVRHHHGEGGQGLRDRAEPPRRRRHGRRRHRRAAHPGRPGRPRRAARQPTQLAPGDTAQIGPDGLAIAPASAPDPVKAIIAAGNEIASKPYLYGGGHGKWNDSGYDCSGSVSYALHGAGLLDQALASGDFESWGDAGPGQWVTIYAKASHVYMVVAGLRFDTSGRTKNNTRWQSDMRSSSGYVARHPTGL